MILILLFLAMNPRLDLLFGSYKHLKDQFRHLYYSLIPRCCQILESNFLIRNLLIVPDYKLSNLLHDLIANKLQKESTFKY